MSEKTLILFTESPNEGSDNSLFFFELNGDYRRWDKTYINATETGFEEELGDFLYKNGTKETHYLNPEVKKLAEPTKDWTYFIQVGFYL